MILHAYKNGNADVEIHSDGTRIIECEGELDLEYPLNTDVRLSRKCAFGYNKNTDSAVCRFCHESATTDGTTASRENIFDFFRMMHGLPKGTEIAVGVNQNDDAVELFLFMCFLRDYVANVTVNQGMVHSMLKIIKEWKANKLIHGLGISYRKGMKDIPVELLNMDDTVVHVIAGIDSIEDIKELASKGVNKLLVLGEKDFGFNLGKVKIVSDSHREWYRKVHELFSLFKVVSFDNLAVEQLNIKRFVKNWEETYQHEFSFYANIVDGTFSPSSRSADTVPFKPVSEYFAEMTKP